MDPVRNPYAPGAGTPPPELAGRGQILLDARTALRRVQGGRAERSVILVGLRGVGKTVLLVKIKEIADDLGFKAAFIEAQENRSLASLIIPMLRSILLTVDFSERARDVSKRALRVLKSFIGSVKISTGDIDYGLTINPEVGVADSGDLQADLSDLMVAVGEAAKAAEKAICVLIDELQYVNEVEFSALIMAIHRVNQLNLPIIVVGAGLPQILAHAGSAKSYAERLFRFPQIGALEPTDAVAALSNPAVEEGVEYDADALEEILKTTERYPYFIQQWGHDSWNHAKGTTISLDDVREATKRALATLDESFFKVRFDRCTPAERRYMRALAELGPGPHRSGDIAEALGTKSTSVAPVRSKLISKGMIYSPQHGDTAFTVPLFDAYMRRIIPTFDVISTDGT
ncbi:ATP-binding protein [Rhizobiales bacterium Sp-1]|uniref:ATP-binding protein n=1 Tax=Segnochrobactrum spirostomi TaxID=2608987 RepID=A0A6A7Y6U4_9HYPH|nr:ATP-binding protein [Segnochrobactrum spirostomi]